MEIMEPKMEPRVEIVELEVRYNGARGEVAILIFLYLGLIRLV